MGAGAKSAKIRGPARQEAEGAGGRRLIYFRRSDFFGINLDDDAAAILEVVLWIVHYAHLGAYLFAGESGRDSISNIRHFATHDVALPTAILAMNVQCVERPHRPLNRSERQAVPRRGVPKYPARLS